MKDFDTARTIVAIAIHRGWIKPGPRKPEPKLHSNGQSREKRTEQMRRIRAEWVAVGLTAQGWLRTRKWTDRNGLSKNHTLYMRWYREQKGNK